MSQPMNPRAGVAGPGKFSKRTDTLPSAYYGEGVETAAINSGAAKAKTRGIADNVGGRPANPATPVVPLSAPSQRPEEPITTGIDMGAGAGSEALGMPMPTVKISDTLAKMIPYDSTGEAAILYQQFLAKGM
jgi:hypothetical protein